MNEEKTTTEEFDVETKTTIKDRKIKTEITEITLIGQNDSTIYTNEINGHIEAIHYDITQPVELRMFLEDTPEKSILYFNTIHGVDMIILRKIAQDGVGDQFNYSHEKIPVDGRIGIQIKGMKGSRATIKIKYS